MTLEQLETLAIPLTSKQLIRLDAVRKGILDDKDIRQLGRELQCDEGTVRRDIGKLCLPPEKFQELLEGRPYEHIKKEQAQLERQRQQQAELARLREEAKNAPKNSVFHCAYTAERDEAEKAARIRGASQLHRQGR